MGTRRFREFKNDPYPELTRLRNDNRGKLSGKTYIYIISEGEAGPVKIGRSRNPDFRLADLQIGNPRKLRLFCTWEIEKHGIAYRLEEWIYKTLRPSSIYCGGEWFGISEVVAEQVVDAAIADCRKALV
jgi:hypothetical protein